MEHIDKIYILGDDFEIIAIIDVYESLIWTIRFKEPGEFEFYTPCTKELIEVIKVDRYLYNSYFYSKENDTAHLMVIEAVDISEDHIKVTGRDLKSILDRRIVWGLKSFLKDTSVASLLNELVDENIVNPEIADRKISNFVWDDPSSFLTKTIEEDTQYNGETILEVVKGLMEKHDFGFDVIFNFTDKCFHMYIIQPKDHGYEQTDNPPVIFASKFDNLKKSNYVENITNYKNVAFVSGERYPDDEIDKYFVTSVIGEGAGLSRRELFIDASSIVHVEADGDEWEDSYPGMIEEYGKTELNKEDHSWTKTFDGEVDTIISGYKFMEDYDIGDYVEIINPWNISGTVRMTEMVLSINTSGITAIPTFERLNDTDGEVQTIEEGG